ncbi:MAG TPA: exodeoxyribonuclease VII large subunit [Opitutae bacterium]|nr:exodeoxyribonuclease VII large subunit [Opitutae bacterium]
MLDDFLKPAADQVLKVSELTRHIKRQLEGNFRQVWVQGEVSNLRRQSSGHVYFSLKDASSQLPCVLFARDAAQQNFQLEDGMELQLFGDLSVYEPHGRYQLIAKVAIQSGEGKLQIEYERLKRKLAAEGLFDKERKQALPKLPLKIAVITSPSGAAVRDFLRILRRRNYGGEVVIFPARVQGQGAATEVTAMLKHADASHGFDLVVITRGGGSIEDLWAFNEEPLARAVAACNLPIISAIGHEIDHVLTDYAADQRAETPSAAAELISSLYLEAVQTLATAEQNLAYYADTAITERGRNLHDFLTRLQLIAPDRQIEHLGMKLDDMENRLGNQLREHVRINKDRLSEQAQQLSEHHPRVKLQLASQSLRTLEHQLLQAVKVCVSAKKEHLSHLQKRHENGDLNATLKRGYTVLQDPKGTIIDSAQTAQEESELIARFHDGQINLEVRK